MFLFLILADVSQRQGHDRITSWSRSAFQKPLSPQPCSPTLATFTDVPDNCDALIMGTCQIVASEKYDEYLPPDTHTEHLPLKNISHGLGTLHVALSFFKIIFKKSIYFWLSWVFVAAQSFLWLVSGDYSSLHCTGFLLQWLVLFRSTGSGAPSFTWAQWLRLPCSRVQAQWLWHMGLVALRHMGFSWIRGSNSSLLFWWVDFFTTEPPGKPHVTLFKSSHNPVREIMSTPFYRKGKQNSAWLWSQHKVTYSLTGVKGGDGAPQSIFFFLLDTLIFFINMHALFVVVKNNFMFLVILIYTVYWQHCLQHIVSSAPHGTFNKIDNILIIFSQYNEKDSKPEPVRNYLHIMYIW